MDYTQGRYAEAAAWTTVALTGILSLPALLRGLKVAVLPSNFYPAPVGYQDADGEATEESIKAYSDFRSRLASWFALLVGLGSAVATRLLDPSHMSEKWSWANLISWGLIGLQLVTLPSKRRYLEKYRLVVLGCVASLILAVAIALRQGFGAFSDVLDTHHAARKARVVGVLYIAQIFAAIAMALSFSTFQRRPDVFFNGHRVDRQDTVSLFDRLTYSWNAGAFDVCRERQVQLDDLPTLNAKTRSKFLHPEFFRRRGPPRPLWWQLIRTHARGLGYQWAFMLFNSAFTVVPEFVFYRLLAALENRQESSLAMLLCWVLALFLGDVIEIFSYASAYWVTQAMIRIPVTSQLQALIFSKALRLYESTTPPEIEDEKEKGKGKKKKDGAEGEDTTAKKEKKEKEKEKEDTVNTKQSVINHMKIDTDEVNTFTTYNDDILRAVFVASLSLTFLVNIVGWKATLAGLCGSATIVPFNLYLTKKLSTYQMTLMTLRDNKSNLLSEALSGMRQIRYSAMELYWERKILKARDEELRQLWWLRLFQCFLVFVINLGPFLLAGLTLGVYIWEEGENVRASVIFSSMSLINNVDELVRWLPYLMTYMVDAYVAVKRLDKYLNQPDMDAVLSPGKTIKLENATVCWPGVKPEEVLSDTRDGNGNGTGTGSSDGNSDEGSGASQKARSTLRNVNVSFPRGKLSVIAGKTGAGKSLLLSAILGEVKLVSGKIRVPEKPEREEEEPTFISESEWIVPNLMAYVSQNPWIEGGSVRDNILFGYPMVEARYQAVLKACSLLEDIDVLVDGDDTEIGPKGFMLSGGQRWRTALARALYSRSGILILDDVLSAVDSHVGKTLADHALSGPLAAGRTVILATHHLELVLPIASYLVRLSEGEVEYAGKQTRAAGEPDNKDNNKPAQQAVAAAKSDVVDSAKAAGTEAGPGQGQPVAIKKKTALTEDEATEKRESGGVKWDVYKGYWKAGGGLHWWSMPLIFIVSNVCLNVVRQWSLKEMADGSSGTQLRPRSGLGRRSVEDQVVLLGDQADYLAPSLGSDSRVIKGDVGGKKNADHILLWFWIYIGVYMIIEIVMELRSIAAFIVGQRAARRLYIDMTYAVLRVPLRWLDTVPTGRILNRFTTDVIKIDRQLADLLFMSLRQIFTLATIIIASSAASPWVALLGLALFVLYGRLANEFRMVAREAKRINSTSNSPIYDQLTTVMTGLSAVRAYGRQRFYENRMYKFIDENAKSDWVLNVANRWLQIRMGLIGAVFIATVAFCIVISDASAGFAGFVLVFSMRYSSVLSSMLQMLTNIELNFNATERIIEYTKLDLEPQGGEDAPASWPARGEIEVHQLSVAYAKHLPTVLKQLTFTVKPGERVGVVGRTGAGKSTLASVLFRLLEAGEGSVRIDGVDISKLKLATLRSRLAIVPQDPFLFSGTLRSNLDMEERLDDAEVFSALRRVHLIGDDNVAAEAGGPLVDLTDDNGNSNNNDNNNNINNKDNGAADEQGSSSSDNGRPASPSSPNDGKVINVFKNLSTAISAGGLNMSQGQRQLVCLARVLLARPKILVMDEATSSLDHGTDKATQVSLREEFQAHGCTVFVIAHRLSTVADFDRILVLDRGRLIENGSPRELLEAGIERARQEKEQEQGQEQESDDKKKAKGKSPSLSSSAAAAAAAVGTDTDTDTLTSRPTTAKSQEGQELMGGMVGAAAAGGHGDDESDAGSTTDVENEGEDASGSGSSHPVEGTFYGLVQKSAEKDTLYKMILGHSAEEVEEDRGEDGGEEDA